MGLTWVHPTKVPGARNTYAYDKAGNLASLIDASGTTSYAFDDINRLTALTSPAPGGTTNAITYAYTDLANTAASPNAAQRQTATYPGGLKQIIESNPSGNLTSTRVTNGAGTTLQGYSYSYATVGEPQRALVQSRTEQPANNTTTYSYSLVDDAQRLIAATTRNGSGSTIEDWSYVFDPAGNRTRRTFTTGSTTTTTNYVYNEADQLCWSASGISTSTCGAPPTGATTYAYDAVGNQTSGGQGYDALNRATAMSSTTLGYLTPGNQELTSYGTTAYQNSLLGLSRQLPASGATTTYVRQPDGNPVAQRTSTTKNYLFGDRLGSITAVADDNTNALTRTYDYNPDGNRTSATTGTGTAAETDLALAGGHTLPNGLIHYSARYYNPVSARWTQQDPVNQNASLQEGSRYEDAGGKPINATDVNGLWGISVGFNLVAGVGGKLKVSVGSGGASVGVQGGGGASAGVDVKVGGDGTSDNTSGAYTSYGAGVTKMTQYGSGRPRSSYSYGPSIGASVGVYSQRSVGW